MKDKLSFLLAAVLAILFMLGAVPMERPQSAAAGSPPDLVLVKFKNGVSLAERGTIHRQVGGQVVDTISGIDVDVVAVPGGKGVENAGEYARNPRVLFAEENHEAQAVEDPNDPYFGYQWGLQKVQASSAWDITRGAPGISIAILDTGVDLAHSDISGKVLASVNFTDSPTAADIYGHGTHVAGIAAAATNNTQGVAGLGYNSTIFNVKVLGDSGSGYYSWVASGIVWAADNGAKVINMSLGGSSASSTLEAAVNYAWSKGAVVVAAAGNNGSSAPFYPAYYQNAIAVAATDNVDQLASFSNRGDWVDASAPGVSIYSTLVNSGYGYKSGTSMASPHVAGLAALVFTTVTDSDSNGLLNDEVRTRIESTCDSISASGVGCGRVNAYKAVQSSAAPPPPAPTTGDISGKVADASTGASLAGATVTDGTRSATTDASGAYTLTGVPEGSYTVSASASGYASASQTVSVVAGQTSTASFVLAVVPPPTKLMWVESVAFRQTGRNLRIDVKVVGEGEALPEVNVALQLSRNGTQIWNFTGVTDSYGNTSFTVLKASAGDYLGIVTSLIASDYIWDTTKGVTSASYTISGTADRNK